uniref:Bm12905 n=3 Tax=Brugia TaxID=6278 RepID=A0A0I9N7Z4_BRUMA|nr:Bm12905 [Brugia malayi]
MTKIVSTSPICNKCENFYLGQDMKMGDSVGLIYAGIIIVGGFVGYLKAGSTASLAAGLVFGGIAGFGAQFNNNSMLLAVSSGLTLIMGARFIQSGKVMPSGIVAILRCVSTPFIYEFN